MDMMRIAPAAAPIHGIYPLVIVLTLDTFIVAGSEAGVVLVGVFTSTGAGFGLVSFLDTVVLLVVVGVVD